MSLERLLKKAQGKNVPPKGEVEKPDSGAVGDSAVGLMHAIDFYMTSRNKPYTKKINGFHPSYTRICPRWWYYMFEGVPAIPKIGPRLYRIFDNGHKVHERLYEYFEAMDILIDSEIPIKIKDPVPIVGTADGIISWGGYKLIELKSISTEGFQFRKFYKKAKPDHNIQAQIYMHALKLEKGYIIYEDKNNQDILVIEIERDEEIYNKKIRQWKKAYDKVIAKELPKRPYKQDSQTCQECDLLEHCWRE